MFSGLQKTPISNKFFQQNQTLTSKKIENRKSYPAQISIDVPAARVLAAFGG
jgi:hypothetical protein